MQVRFLGEGAPVTVSPYPTFCGGVGGKKFLVHRTFFLAQDNPVVFACEISVGLYAERDNLLSASGPCFGNTHMEHSLNRRQFLQRGSLAVGGTLAALSASRGAEETLPIIDPHQHLWDLKKFRLALDQEGFASGSQLRSQRLQGGNQGT